VCQSVSKPVNAIMGLKSGSFSLSELAALGVKRISVGSALSRAALGSFIRAAKEMKERGTFDFAKEAIPFAEVNEMMGG
jgi:2-methylisocitrate lyase-like PEP mutase family enzyme